MNSKKCFTVNAIYMHYILVVALAHDGHPNYQDFFNLEQLNVSRNLDRSFFMVKMYLHKIFGNKTGEGESPYRIRLQPVKPLHYVIKSVSYLQQIGGFLRVLWFPPPIKLTATI
jgi:hypothetical protein